MTWYLYLVRCSDGSLYTGITTNLKRRVAEHNNDNLLGSKYVRYKRPVELMYFEEFTNQSEAAKRESAVKRWNRKEKLKLVEGSNFTNSMVS